MTRLAFRSAASRICETQASTRLRTATTAADNKATEDRREFTIEDFFMYLVRCCFI